MGTGEETIAAGTLLRRIGAPSDIAGSYMLPSDHPSRCGALRRAEVVPCYLAITPPGAALFLASEAGAWVTGITLSLDGGSLLSPTSSL